MEKLKQVMSNLKNRGGYVSIETVIVAGLILALGAFGISQFYDASEVLLLQATDKVTETMYIVVSQDPIE